MTHPEQQWSWWVWSWVGSPLSVLASAGLQLHNFPSAGPPSREHGRPTPSPRHPLVRDGRVDGGRNVGQRGVVSEG